MNYSGQNVPGTPPPTLVQAWHRAGAQSVHAGPSRALGHGPQVPRGTLQFMEMPGWVSLRTQPPPIGSSWFPCPPSSCSRGS